MPADEQLSAHFFLSHLTVSPMAGRAGFRNEPLGPQIDNLRRLAQQLELARKLLNGAPIVVLRAFRQLQQAPGARDPACEGRSAEFIAPEFGSPREICAHLVANGLQFERLVHAGKWVQLDIPAFGVAPRGAVQTGVFEHGQPMRYMEGLL